MTTISHALARIKGELARFVPESLIRPLVAAEGRDFRQRTLTPVVTAYLALRQVLHGHVSAAGLRHVAGIDFTPRAYGEARKRLSVSFFRGLMRAVPRFRRTIRRARRARSGGSARTRFVGRRRGSPRHLASRDAPCCGKLRLDELDVLISRGTKLAVQADRRSGCSGQLQ